MTNPKATCPFAATVVRFIAYAVKADFEYHPEAGAPFQQYLFHFRFESPNPFSARASAIREIRRIKCIMDQGLSDPDAKYQYEGIKLWLEYEISLPCGEISPETKKLYLLDGEIGSREVILQRLSNEEFLLDTMGNSFIRGSIVGSDGQEYSALVDELFDGLSEIEGDLIQKPW